MSIGTHAATADRRAEVKLLLGCTRTEMQAMTAQQIRQALQEKIDWNYVIQQATYHGTIPLLFRHLNHHFANHVPKRVLGRLRNASNGITCWNLALTGELLKLLKLLQEQGIRALPLKGPALAIAAYGNLALRQFCDLDILVSKEDMLKAKEVLMSHGYHPTLELTASQEAAYLESHHDYKFVRAKDGVAVEIQWHITQWKFAFPFDFEDAWKHREVIILAGGSVFNLAPEILLLMLCVHGTKHRWEQLKWICDIAQVLDSSRQKLDWDRLMDKACTLGGERMLLLGLWLAHHLLGAVLNQEILKRIDEERQVKHLAGKVSERLFDVVSRSDNLQEEPPFFYWRSRERWRDKWALLLRYLPEYFSRVVLPNERDQAFLQLPSCLYLGYYCLRPLRLIHLYWSNALQRFYR